MPQQDPFTRRYGFPRPAATLANWREPPFSRWAFQNLRELVPTAPIASPRGEAGTRTEKNLPEDALDIRGAWETAEAFLRRSSTDIFLALKRGRPAAWWHAPHAAPDEPHLLFSISKSMTALVAGVLSGEGALDLEGPVAAVVPEAEGSAFGDASVRDLLDMRVGLDFEEDYTDATGPFARYRRATLWNPPAGGEPETLRPFLLSLGKGPHEHGGPFRYRSPNSDFLGLVLEQAAGERLPALLRRGVLEPTGATGEAYVTVDGAGAARAAGGMLMTARDLARAGELMRNAGTSDGRRVLPQAFVRDTLENGSREAWAAGDMATLLPGGAYRNKWYAAAGGAFMGIGIHGQWLYVAPKEEATIVKFSSQPEAVDLELDLDTLAFLAAIARLL